MKAIYCLRFGSATISILSGKSPIAGDGAKAYLARRMHRSSFISTRLQIERSATARCDLLVEPLDIEKLEAGLDLLDHGAQQNAFWDKNIAAFRQTVLVAIGETSDALLSKNLTTARRADLEEQVRALQHCIEVADSYVARRARISELHDGGRQPLKIN